MERKNAWKEYTEAEVSELEKLNESYRKFLDAGKTERECVKQAVAMAEAAGYLDLKKCRGRKKGESRRQIICC